SRRRGNGRSPASPRWWLSRLRARSAAPGTLPSPGSALRRSGSGSRQVGAPRRPGPWARAARRSDREGLPMRPGLLLTFAAMGVATYLTRAPLLFALARRRLPDWLERYFAALPIALITALALPLVLLAPGNAVPGWVTDLPAAVVVAVLARRTGHLLVA